MTDPFKPWVLVAQAGLTAEVVVCECYTYDDAWTAMHERYTCAEQDELHIDIMRRLDDGTLTTEY